MQMEPSGVNKEATRGEEGREFTEFIDETKPEVEPRRKCKPQLISHPEPEWLPERNKNEAVPGKVTSYYYILENHGSMFKIRDVRNTKGICFPRKCERDSYSLFWGGGVMVPRMRRTITRGTSN